MSDEELKAELERLRRENAALRSGASSGIRIKVSEKGAVSIYGMGRFPVTLYKEQWSPKRLPAHSQQVPSWNPNLIEKEILWAGGEFQRNGSARCDLHRQNPVRGQACRSARGASVYL